MDCSLPGSSLHGILQARVLEWVAISFSRGSSQPGNQTGVSALQADSLPIELSGKRQWFVMSIQINRAALLILVGLIHTFVVNTRSGRQLFWSWLCSLTCVELACYRPFWWLVHVFSHVRLSATPWTVAHQAPLSMEFSRQDYWSGLPFPTPVDHPSPGIEPASLGSPALTGGFFTTSHLVGSPLCNLWNLSSPTCVPCSGCMEIHWTTREFPKVKI